MSLRRHALEVAALWNLAIAQPCYAVLGPNAELFVAHGAGAATLIAGALGLSLGIPLLLALLPWSLTRAAPRLGRIARVALLAALAAVGALSLADRALGHAGADFVACVALFACVAVGIWRSPAPGRFLRLASPCALLFPLAFLLFSPVSRLLLPATPAAAGRGAGRSIPVVVVVLDELSTVSLLDANGLVDAQLFPGFARLAGASHWFRNATTVSHSTEKAVPALLTGRRPQPGQLPILADHPENLFSLLAPTHRVRALESVTALCPPDVCREGHGQPARPPTSLLRDVAIVALHVLSPGDWRARLPSLAGRFSGFGTDGDTPQVAAAAAPGAADLHGVHRKARFERFVASLEVRDEPTLDFLHVMLPHVPYQFLPDGRVYTAQDDLPGWDRPRERWEDDAALVARAERRYLLQLRFVDTLISSLLARLESLGLDDQAILIVTADHGVSFRPGETRRGPAGEAAVDVLPVPLFIREPGQRVGRIHDANVESIDVLPTLAALLDLAHAADLPGAAALPGPAVARSTKQVFFQDRARSFGADFVPRLLAGAGRASGLCRAGDAGPDLFACGARGASLVGAAVDSGAVAARRASGPAVRIDHAGRFEAVDPAAAFVPAWVRGRLVPPAAGANPVPAEIAIAANGRISALSRVRARDGEWRFSGLVPPGHLRPGRNEIAIYALDPASNPLRLARLPLAAAPRAPTDPGSEQVLGQVGRLETRGATLRIAGWAADADTRAPASAIVVFAGDTLVHEQHAFVDRPDVARAFGSSLHASGFDFVVPKAVLGDAAANALRVYARLEGERLAELAVPDR